MLKKVSTVMVTLLLAASVTVTAFSPTPAEARHGRKAAAIVGGTILGLLALDALTEEQRARGCYHGRRHCHWVRRQCYRDEWGDRVCEPGHEECRRRVICD